MKIHENIKALREKHGLTLEELGKRIGTTKQTIKRYESGEINNIPYDKIIDLAKCFGVSPSYLMGWENPKEMASEDTALSKMESRLKEYALKMSELSKEKQDLVLKMIDELGK